MRYYIVAGEASGDMHAANLMLALKKGDPEAEFRCWGGERMEMAGGVLARHYKDLAFMGFWEVLKNINTIRKNLNYCKEDLKQYNPDLVILVDYPGFNFRLLQFIKQNGFKLFYYISPQLWAWNSSRVKRVKAYVDKMFVILPFEKAFYKEHDYEVEYGGHPLLDEISKFTTDPEFRSKNGLDERPVIALLPGSRKQEIKRLLPVMLNAIEGFENYQFIIAGVPHLKDLYGDLLNDSAKVIFEDTYNILHHAEAALVTSGTATLETALFEVPEVVCYKGNPFSFFLGKMLVDVPYISLVNLIMDEEVITELIQKECNEPSIREELMQLLQDERQKQLKSKYKVLKDKLGGSGASERNAEAILKVLK